MALAVATPALANFSGAIYTTMADCTTVNGNIYDDKQDVYLNGGPQNSNASGLPANTVFYVKVTEPDGTLLSAVSTPDTITSDGDGNLPCTQLWGLLHKQSDGTPGYDTTTNNGSEYKVWISTERDFPHDDSKTDNFKVVVDEEPPPVPAADNLTVTKTADPTFDRSFTWLIDKDVDNTSLNGLFGTATFNYSVAVTKSAASDSGWKVTGTISVTNPNADPVTGVDVSDDIGNEAADTCVVTGGSNATIQAQSTSQFEYTCTYSAAPAAAAQTNTATATWPSQDLAHSTALAGSSATFDAGFTFDNGDMGNPNLSDNCITITDANAPAGTFPPSTCASDSYNYSHAFAVPASGCQSHPNTASFVADTTGATGSDTVTVSVCRVAPNTGALTIGFWQNKNGQAIITGGTATAGVCDAGTWLRAYAPFADLTLGSNCAKVATYVFNVIKAAACTSTSKTCNSGAPRVIGGDPRPRFPFNAAVLDARGPPLRRARVAT